MNSILPSTARIFRFKNAAYPAGIDSVERSSVISYRFSVFGCQLLVFSLQSLDISHFFLELV